MNQKVLLGLLGLSSLANAATTCDVTPISEPGTNLYEEGPLKLIKVTSEKVTFTVSQTWTDEVLCLLATHFEGDDGEECPMSPNAGPGEVAEYEAVCKDGKASIGIYAYDPSFPASGTDFTIPSLCEQTRLEKTEQYLYEIPCGVEETCAPLSCAYVEDSFYDFDTQAEGDEFIFGAWESGYLKLSDSNMEASKTFDVPADTEKVTAAITVFAVGGLENLPSEQTLYIRAGPYYFNLSSKLGKTDATIDEDYFGKALVTTAYDAITNSLTFTVSIDDLYKETGRLLLGVKTSGGGEIAVDGVSVSLECSATSSPGWEDNEERECGGGGDPHFQRWGRAHSSFHGECDLVMIHSDQFHNNAGLDLHVRTTIEDYFSYIETAALRVGETVMEFHKDHFYMGEVKMTPDSLPLTFGDDFQYTISNGEIGENKNPLYYQYYKVDLHDRSSILFKFYKQYLTISVSGSARDFADANGLMGDFKNGEMLSRNGAVLTDFDSFGFEWQVNPTDNEIFRSDRAPQLPYERCRMPTAARPSRRHLRGDKALMEQAMKACAHVRGSDFDLCADDVMTTGDVGLATLW